MNKGTRIRIQVTGPTPLPRLALEIQDESIDLVSLDKDDIVEAYIAGYTGGKVTVFGSHVYDVVIEEI